MFQSNEVFNGAIPPVCMMQILKAVDFSSWNGCYVGCSGTFTFERAIGKRWPQLDMHGNDVSLMSRVLAGLALKQEVPFSFKGRLAHWEKILEGQPYSIRVGAMLVALFAGRLYGSDNEYNRRHFRYYETRLLDYAATAYSRALALAAELRLSSYHHGDFRDHLETGMANGSGVIVSAPFIEGWYEKWFRFIAENLEYEEADYRLWNPGDFPELMERVDASGVPYVMVYRENIPGKLACYHRIGMKPRFYVYSNTAASSVVDQSSTEAVTPFRYKPVDIDRITADTKVEIRRCKAGYADYIKSVYLQETIQWTSGPLNFLVYLDDMLAGILTFTPPKHGIGPYNKGDYLYLLSDTATTRYGRISKLLAMLATCKEVIHVGENTLLRRPALGVVTTVRSNQPASMKYRGPYKVLKRMEADESERSGSRYIINYHAPVREDHPQEIYADWFKRYFKDDRAREVKTSYGK
jgi:hypothetical protein